MAASRNTAVETTGGVASLRAEPGLEGGAGLDVDPLEEVPPKRRDLDRFDPGRRSECQHVDERVSRQRKDDRIAADLDRRSERPAQLGEVPAQCTERVISVAEQQLGEALARNRGLGDDQVREEGPRLPAPRAGSTLPVDFDPGRTQQVDADRPHAPRPFVGRCSRRERRDSPSQILA